MARRLPSRQRTAIPPAPAPSSRPPPVGAEGSRAYSESASTSPSLIFPHSASNFGRSAPSRLSLEMRLRSRSARWTCRRRRARCRRWRCGRRTAPACSHQSSQWRTGESGGRGVRHGGAQLADEAVGHHLGIATTRSGPIVGSPPLRGLFPCGSAAIPHLSITTRRPCFSMSNRIRR